MIVLDADVVADAQPGVVVDEAGLHVLAEHLARELVAEVLAPVHGLVVVVRRSRRSRGSTGTQPMPPSASANFTVGNLRRIGDHSSSEQKTPVWNGIEWGITSNGERGMKLGTPPKWNTITVPVSSHACHAGSHSSPWWSGMPKRCGSEWNETAWQPFSATRRISLGHPLGAEHEAGERRAG